MYCFMWVRRRNGVQPALGPPFSDGAEFCLDRANMTKKQPFFFLGTAGRYFISLAENISNPG